MFGSVTFHFCLAKNFFIFSLDRLLVDVTSPEANFSIQGWARPPSQEILFLIITKTVLTKNDVCMSEFCCCRVIKSPWVFV